MNARIVGVVVFKKDDKVVKKVYVQKPLKTKLAPLICAAFSLKYKKDHKEK